MTILDKAEQYALIDNQIKKLEKDKKLLNTEIKTYMRENALSTISVNGFTVSFGTQERVTMNEQSLLTKVKELNLTDAIKVIEVVDQDVLESKIYNGELNASEIESCMERKTVEVLNVKKSK